MGEYSHISHTFLPVYDESSKTLILGSFPSVKSREQGFYYGHPQNRFWKVLAAVCGCEVPVTAVLKMWCRRISLVFYLKQRLPRFLPMRHFHWKN